MKIIDELKNREKWEEFLAYKKEKQHVSKSEYERYFNYIKNETYLRAIDKYIVSKDLPLPKKNIINKIETGKQRTVYTYEDDFKILLKMITNLLYKYNDYFCENCYAFRKNYGVKDAINKIKTINDLKNKYVLKVDISNYFNSIDTDILLEQLSFLKEEDEEIYELFYAILNTKKCIYNDEVIEEKMGAMAGVPLASFSANVYLTQMDKYFFDNGINYFRYSDDILIFAESIPKREEYKTKIFEFMEKYKLTINSNKFKEFETGEEWDFLGLCYRDGNMDLSELTVNKIKAKIRRKARALKRWADKKNLGGEKAAKGFINAINKKFYEKENEDSFSWSKWYFPNLTTDKSLKEIDRYIVYNIRFCVTGKHNDANFRVSYEKLKEWGYKSLVHEFYKKSINLSEK